MSDRLESPRKDSAPTAQMLRDVLSQDGVLPSHNAFLERMFDKLEAEARR